MPRGPFRTASAPHLRGPRRAPPSNTRTVTDAAENGRGRRSAPAQGCARRGGGGAEEAEVPPPQHNTQRAMGGTLASAWGGGGFQERGSHDRPVPKTLVHYL